MADIKKFLLSRDISGLNGFSSEFSQYAFSVTLEANLEATFTIPEPSFNIYKSILLIFSIPGGTSVWVSCNDTATVPASNSFQFTTSERNPAGRVVEVGDVISVITNNDNVEVGVSLYAIDY